MIAKVIVGAAIAISVRYAPVHQVNCKAAANQNHSSCMLTNNKNGVIVEASANKPVIVPTHRGKGRR